MCRMYIEATKLTVWSGWNYRVNIFAPECVSGPRTYLQDFKDIQIGFGFDVCQRKHWKHFQSIANATVTNLIENG